MADSPKSLQSQKSQGSPKSPSSEMGREPSLSKRPAPIITQPQEASPLVFGLQQQQVPIMVNWGKLLCFNLDEFPEFDPTAEVSSPRSLEACEAEGIRPQDLTYVPYEAFEAMGASPEVCKLRHDFFEARRQDLLLQARKERQRAICKEPGRTTLTMGSNEDAYPHTLAFFRNEHQKIVPNNPPCAKDWTMSPRTEEFKPISSYNSGGGATGFETVSASASEFFNEALDAFPSDSLGDSQFLGTTLGATIPAGLASPTASPMGTRGAATLGSTRGSPLGASLGASWRTEREEGELPELFQTLRESPGGTRVEEDMARRAENDHIELRKDGVKAIKAKHDDTTRLTAKRVNGLGSSFKKFVHEQKVVNRQREIRQYMSPPAGKAGNTGGFTRSRDTLFMQAVQDEGKRQEKLHRFAHRDMEHELKVMEMAYQKRIKFAQVNVEDRLRWRHKYFGVQQDNEEHCENIIENARRRQMQITAISNKAAADNSVKEELHNLRSTVRLLSELQRVRKDTYQDRQIRAVKRQLANQRVEKSLHSASAPNLRKPKSSGLEQYLLPPSVLLDDGDGEN